MNEMNFSFFRNVEIESTEGLVAYMEGPDAQYFMQECPGGLFKYWAWKAHDTEPSLRGYAHVQEDGRILVDETTATDEEMNQC